MIAFDLETNMEKSMQYGSTFEKSASPEQITRSLSNLLKKYDENFVLSFFIYNIVY